MNQQQTFEKFLATATTHIPILSFIVDLLLAALLSYLLSKIYERFASSLSNRKLFAGNFVLIALSTVLIIAIVKSSLALSLGLVGALSIVRFRAAIKEPEELSYLFLTIGIGLGLGANQITITVLAFIIISIILILKSLRAGKEKDQILIFTVQSENSNQIDLQKVIDVLKRNSSALNLRRFDESNHAFEASFNVEFSDLDQMNAAKNELLKLEKSLKIQFLDNSGIF